MVSELLLKYKKDHIKAKAKNSDNQRRMTDIFRRVFDLAYEIRHCLDQQKCPSLSV